MLIYWILIFSLKILATMTLRMKKYPYADMTIEQKTAHDGYPLEQYKTTTVDGYILTIYRIPYGRKNQQVTRSPVLLLHGLGASPQMFLLLGANKSLAYNLADDGFDVWLLNARGNRKSQGHKYYNLNKGEKYWNFGIHEVAVNDITANIDFILNKTQQKPFVIGHSQGNTCFFILMTEKPEYNEKVKIGVAYAPSIKFVVPDNPFMPPILYIVDILKAIYDLFGFYELNPIPSLATIVRDLCKEQTYFIELCFQIIHIIGTHKSKIMDRDLTPVIIGAANGRVSLYQILHYVQFFKTGNFGQYNYGPTINMKLYGNVTPPLYNLRKITSPVILFFGPNDDLGTIKVADDLNKELPNIYLIEKVQFEYFNHLDFLFGRNTSELVYKKTMKIFHDYDNKLKSKTNVQVPK